MAFQTLFLFAIFQTAFDGLLPASNVAGLMLKRTEGRRSPRFTWLFNSGSRTPSMSLDSTGSSEAEILKPAAPSGARAAEIALVTKALAADAKTQLDALHQQQALASAAKAADREKRREAAKVEERAAQQAEARLQREAAEQRRREEATRRETEKRHAASEAVVDAEFDKLWGDSAFWDERLKGEPAHGDSDGMLDTQGMDGALGRIYEAMYDEVLCSLNGEAYEGDIPHGQELIKLQELLHDEREALKNTSNEESAKSEYEMYGGEAAEKLLRERKEKQMFGDDAPEFLERMQWLMVVAEIAEHE